MSTLAGSVTPGSLAVLYQFPYALLDEALKYLFGPKVAAEMSEGVEVDLGTLPSNLFASEEGFQHLRVYLTYVHEQLHIRQLSTSPLGFALWVLHAQEYQLTAHLLQEWGRQVGPSITPRQPLIVHHKTDSAVQQIARTKRTFSLFYQVLRAAPDLSPSTLAETVMPVMMAKLQGFSKKVLGCSAEVPRIKLTLPEEYGIAPKDALSGDAVIEGLARCTEYLGAISLGADVDVLNRYNLEKGVGHYQSAIGAVELLLDVKPPHSWSIAAALLDWALQAPTLSLLLDGREEIALEELLPAWRFPLLLAAFKKRRFTYEHIFERRHEIEEALFALRGWESPRQVAKRIQNLPFKTPSASLTRACVEKLKLGADVRLNTPDALFVPFTTGTTLPLEKGFSVFLDGTILKGGHLTMTDLQEFAMGLLEDATIDGLWVDETLSTPYGVAQWFAPLVGGAKISPLMLLARKLDGLVSPRIAKQLLLAFAN